MVGFADEVSRLVAARATVVLAGMRGAGSGQVACIGYPKSGTSWMAKLLSTSLEIPEPSFYRLPIIRPAVLHGHRFTRSQLPTVYVARDPRDVFVSLYYHRCRVLESDRNPRYRMAMEVRYDSLPGPLNAKNISLNMDEFVRIELKDPRDIRTNWNAHVEWSGRQKISRRNKYIEIRYEDLLFDPRNVLDQVLQVVGNRSVSASRVDEAVAANSFEALSGRNSGESDTGSYYRNGEAGAWTQVLGDDVVDRIVESCGKQMRRLGYVV